MNQKFRFGGDFRTHAQRKSPEVRERDIIRVTAQCDHGVHGGACSMWERMGRTECMDPVVCFVHAESQFQPI